MPSNKKARWGWMLYDWASQPYHTLLVTFIFAPYFTSTVVGDSVQGQAVWGWAVALISLSIAIAAPVLGSIADSTGPRKPWILLFVLMHILGAAYLWNAVPGMDNYMWILVAYGIGFIGVEMSLIFTNAMLPDLVPRKEIGKLSGAGMGLGYAGGLIALFIMLLLLAEGENGKTLIGLSPLFGLDAAAREGTRSVGPFTALWMLVFIIPLFLWTPDAAKKPKVLGKVKQDLADLWSRVKALPAQTSFFSYLMSSMFYRDALNGLYTFGGIYAAGVLGWTITQIGIFGIVAAFAAAVMTWIGGFADDRFGPKPVILFCIWALIVVCIISVSLSRTSVLGLSVAETSSLPDIVFYICGATIGSAGGAMQAASRTLLIDHVKDPGKMTEAFGLYGMSGKATSFLAPLAVAAATQISGSQRIGILPVIALLAIGILLLKWVNPNEEV